MFDAEGWVVLAVTRQGSHGPGRACINASGSSADSFAVPQGSPWLSERVLWTGLRSLDVLHLFPPLSSAGRRFASLHRVLRGEFPCFSGTIKRCDFLPPVPPHFVAFVWRYLSVHSFFSLPGGRVRRRAHCLIDSVTEVWLLPHELGYR